MLGPRRLGSILAVALALLTVPSLAAAKPAKAKDAKGAQSIGAPNAGKLNGAVLLKGSRTLRQRKGAHSWGMPSLVRLLQYAAGRVAKKHRNTMTLIGDLSGRTGGPLPGHASHQTGRDADIGFFVLNSKDKPINVQRFVPFDNAGKGRDLAWASFDDARNWALVEALLSYDKVEVRHVFIMASLRARLLAYAARKHIAKELIERAA